MNILLLGSGGREHALAWKIAQSPKVSKLIVAPGNAGTAGFAHNADVNPADFPAVARLVQDEDVNMVIVGPEDPLVRGIHDFFLNDAALAQIPVIGPRAEAAKLEGSKAYAKEFMQRHNIPTAAYRSFGPEEIEAATHFLTELDPPYVLKADGLAAGKGVLILNDLETATSELRAMLLDSKFGEASSTVVIEEFLDGIELSCFVLTDGRNYKILPTAKDYKRIGEADTGLNTGGMGAISPVPFADDAFMTKVTERIVKPTVEGLQQEGIPYQGFIFIGLIKVGDDPKVIEYNVRMGDPETEVVIPRISSDFVELLEGVAARNLDTKTLEIDPRTAVTVMAVSGGYPGSYQKGMEITGLDRVSESTVFHAGTRLEDERILTNGGRVMAFTSFGKDFPEALEVSYRELEKVDFNGMYYRRDIGFDL